MSKISNALKMYMLLQSRDMMKVGDIASELGVSPRMVKNYKKDFSDVCYYSKGVASVAMENEQEVWRDINLAIDKQKKIKIKYSSIGKNQQDIQD